MGSAGVPVTDLRGAALGGRPGAAQTVRTFGSRSDFWCAEGTHLTNRNRYAMLFPVDDNRNHS
jgi:hypothetical protein